METVLFCLFMIQYYTVHGLLKSLKSTSPKKSSIVENEDYLKQLISYFISLPSMYSLNSPVSIPTWPFKPPPIKTSILFDILWINSFVPSQYYFLMDSSKSIWGTLMLTELVVTSPRQIILKKSLSPISLIWQLPLYSFSLQPSLPKIYCSYSLYLTIYI